MGDLVKNLLMSLKSLIDPLLIALAKAAAKVVGGIVRSTETSKDNAFFRQFAIDLITSLEEKSDV